MNKHDKFNLFLMLLLVIILNAYIYCKKIVQSEGFNIQKEIEKPIKKALEKALSPINGAIDAVKGTINSVKRGIENTINSIENTFTKLIESITKLIKSLQNKITSIISEIKNLPKSLATKTFKSIKNKKIRTYLEETVLHEKDVGKMFTSLAKTLAGILLVVTVMPMMLLMFAKSVVFGSVKSLLSMMVSFFTKIATPPVPDSKMIVGNLMQTNDKIQQLQDQITHIGATVSAS